MDFRILVEKNAGSSDYDFIFFLSVSNPPFVIPVSIRFPLQIVFFFFYCLSDLDLSLSSYLRVSLFRLCMERSRLYFLALSKK